jgi:hypothetical protein
MRLRADPTDPLAWLAPAGSNLRLAGLGAVQARYPGWSEEVTQVEYRQALELARQVVSWVSSTLEETAQ